MSQEKRTPSPTRDHSLVAALAAAGRFFRDDLVAPAVWFLVLAGFCATTGLVVATGRPPLLSEVRYIVLYLLLLLPVFINRQTLYEAADIEQLRRDHITHWYKYIAALSLLLPPLMLLALLGLIAPLAYGRLIATLLAPEVFSPVTLTAEAFPQPHAIASTFGAIVPFYVYAASITKRWPSARLVTFRYRSLLPALMTILLSFTLGWSLSQGPIAVICSAFIVLLFWSCIEIFKPRNVWLVVWGATIIVVTALLVGASIAFGWLPAKYVAPVQVIFLGLLVTSCMVVCEGWRVAVKTVTWDGANATMYMAGANMATCIVLPVFLLTYALHGSTTIVYAVLSLTMVVVLIATWLLPKREGRTYSHWVGVCIGGGLLVPTAVGLTVRIPGAIPNSSWATSLALGVSLGVLVSGVLGVIGVGGRDARECFGALRRWDVQAFGEPRRAWMLVTLVASTCMGVSAAVAILAALLGGAEDGSTGAAAFIAQRCAIVSVLYVVLLVVSLVAGRIVNGRGGEEVR